ncbi:hypothetical protein [Devosia salina]|uniref:hypothetical protein n=1 Tax=Devosia salina TaxID=2860336 RepID=UPI001F0A0744|nr:hypothetical protein [Devosia salina]
MAENGSGKPRQTNLHRATSTAYYAMFHALARCCADLLVGGTGAERSSSAWKQVYRSLSHGPAKKACESKTLEKFPQEIQDFAYMFRQMQLKRHTADYDPTARTHKSTVLVDIDAVEAAIKDFAAVAIKDRRAFAAFVLFPERSA